ncbi:MAG TPA: histidinol dehydrogenase [Longimicrobiales bacterium]
MIALRRSLRELSKADEARLFVRGRDADPEVERAVAAIIADVRARGDDALRGLARRFDRVELSALEVPREACNAALNALDDAVRVALEQAAAAIAAFHRAQIPPPLDVELRPGVRLGRRAEPLRRAGVYAPGGRAAYPSSVLMGVIPAKVAGVEEVVVCSPPGPNGLPHPAVLAACALAGADRVFALGGAGAIAALAYGTASVPRVDRIVGPGNAYVNEAKRQVAGSVGIDSPAGPSELLIVADASADPETIALELLAQAEHDPDAAVAVVATDEALLDATAAALARMLPDQPRRDIIAAALAANGALLLADSLDDALAFVERYAPEHLLLLVRDPRAALERVRAAGTVFLGPHSSVAFGDYITGANHVLPTGGLARAFSGLSVLDFLRFFTVQELSADAAAALARPTATLAAAEGLPAHGRAALARGEGGEGRASADAAARRSAEDPGRSPALAREGGPGRGGALALASAGVRLREAYADIELYDPERRPVEVDLSDNTNLFGTPPAAARSLAELPAERITRYPPVFADELKAVLAAKHGVTPENITTGCGSDDVIDSALRAFCDPGDAVAYADPTFSVVSLMARMNAARPVAVPLAPDFSLDADALIAARARVTYICRPNNPTGTVPDAAAVLRVAEAGRGIVLLDEAYADFMDEPAPDWLAASDRIVVVRTLSKAYGLAGLRVGYAIGPARLIREIEKSRGPYKVTATANAAALAALTEDEPWVRNVARQVQENRERLAAELRVLGLRVWPSQANFVLVQAPVAEGGAASGEQNAARRLGAALRERGVAVRVFPALPHAGDCVRVSVGPWPLMQRFLDALREVL